MSPPPSGFTICHRVDHNYLYIRIYPALLVKVISHLLITDYCACRGNGKNYEITLRCMANRETFDVNHSVWGNNTVHSK